MNPAQLYDALFKGGNKFTGLLEAIKTHASTTLEKNGTTFLDREVGPTDLRFMKQLQLKDMSFELPPTNSNDEKVYSVFHIKNAKNNEKLPFSFRSGNNGELRGTLLIQKLEKMQQTQPEITLYDAIKELYSAKCSQSDFFKFFPPSISAYTDEQTPQAAKEFLAEMADHLSTHLEANPSTLTAKTDDPYDLIPPKEHEYYSKLAQDFFLQRYPSAAFNYTTPMQRFGKTLAFGLSCLALVAVGAALSATGVGTILGVPLLFATGAVFIAGAASAIKIVQTERQYSHDIDNYQDSSALQDFPKDRELEHSNSADPAETITTELSNQADNAQKKKIDASLKETYAEAKKVKSTLLGNTSLNHAAKVNLGNQLERLIKKMEISLNLLGDTGKFKNNNIRKDIPLFKGALAKTQNLQANANDVDLALETESVASDIDPQALDNINQEFENSTLATEYSTTRILNRPDMHVQSEKAKSSIDLTSKKAPVQEHAEEAENDYGNSIKLTNHH